MSIRRIATALLFLVVLSIAKNGFAQEASLLQVAKATELSCSKVALSQFISNWNKETKTINHRSWKLPTLRNKTNYEQALDGPSIVIKIKATSLGCLDTVEIWTRRDQSIAMAALVAWVKTIKVLGGNHKEIIHKLGIDKPSLQAGGKVEESGIIYTFNESISENSFRAVIM